MSGLTHAAFLNSKWCVCRGQFETWPGGQCVLGSQAIAGREDTLSMPSPAPPPSWESGSSSLGRGKGEGRKWEGGGEEMGGGGGEARSVL